MSMAMTSFLRGTDLNLRGLHFVIHFSFLITDDSLVYGAEMLRNDHKGLTVGRWDSFCPVWAFLSETEVSQRRLFFASRDTRRFFFLFVKD